MNAKDKYELDYWKQASVNERIAEYRSYLEAWNYQPAESVIEIGCGPFGGCLALVDAKRKVGIDPLIDEYAALGLLPKDDVSYYACGVEQFTADEQFNAVITANAIDHGDLDFGIIPKLASFLKPGGRLYIHVHLRPESALNEGHDHALKEADLDRYLGDLVEIKRLVMPRDVTGTGDYPALVGVWQKPEVAA